MLLGFTPNSVGEVGENCLGVRVQSESDLPVEGPAVKETANQQARLEMERNLHHAEIFRPGVCRLEKSRRIETDKRARQIPA